jgi:carboxyl-terminal processing protease
MEQLSADSIQFNDSLKYQTKSGRTVYGGGGIMPDIFVPADTSGNSAYFDKIYRKGLIYTFAYTYADNNRETLAQFEKAEEIDAYLNKQDVLEEFVNYAQEKGIQRDANGLKQSQEIIKTQLKAYIARNIIGEEGFFPIIRQIDNTLERAIEISKQNLLVENIVSDSIL